MRRLTEQDRADLVDLDTIAFVGDPDAMSVEEASEHIDLSRSYGAEHPDTPGRLAGLYSSFELHVRVPGNAADGTRLVPVNGLTWVGVDPDMRRRGVLSAMMRHYLQDARDRGDAIVALHASEAGIYGRYGFSVASLDVGYTLGRGTTFTAPASVVEAADATRTAFVRRTDADEFAARCQDLDRRSPALGTVVVPDALARHYLRDRPASRRGKEPRRAIVASRDGQDVGVAVFRRTADWERSGPNGSVNVHHLAAVDAGAMLALGRRLVDMDLMGKTVFSGRGLDDPLLAWTPARSASIEIGDALWLRPVDVAGMLTARGYAAPARVTLGITDTTLEHNTGTWLLDIDDEGVAECTRTDTVPDVECDVDVLGELYLGLRGPAALAATGRLGERTPGTIRALAAALATGTGPIGGTSF
ncbi:MAG: GNAT family N-acetyltransferase [Mobilicoccus sp.]|nr:GNAT family N-acetyltransferase [Mobilicoccus sp.]